MCTNLISQPPHTQLRGVLQTTADKADDLFTSYSAGLADRTKLKHGFCAGLKLSKMIRDDVTK